MGFGFFGRSVISSVDLAVDAALRDQARCPTEDRPERMRQRRPQPCRVGAASLAASSAASARSCDTRAVGLASVSSQALVERNTRLRRTASWVTADRFKLVFLACAA